MKFDILLIDDEPIVRRSLARLLAESDWTIHEAGSGADGCDVLGRLRPDVAIIDLCLGDMNGIEVIEALRQRSPDTVPVVLTAYGSVSAAVDALKKGAYDFLQKDGDPQFIRHVVGRAVEKARLRRELEELRRARLAQANLPQIICRSARLRSVMATVDEYARTSATVLIEGETGVGKNLVAEYIHYASDRADRPFVTINCGAIPKELIESELFGYAEGAFTGARQRGKIGLIKRADGGTLFLDEIGDLSLELQSKLLHVLETREYLAVGAVEPTSVNVRFISATNCDLARQIADGRFRRDLYYRLNVAAVSVPPLRERTEDILPLARHFINRFNAQYGRNVTTITPDAERLLERCPWTGNVRELRNAIERALLLKRTDTLEAADLACLEAGDGAMATDGEYSVRVNLATGTDVLQELTRQVVLHAWQRSDRNQSQAARMLGIPRTTFQTYMQKYGLSA
jgi:two-component system, NtrC family, response regulator AtoC